MSSRAQRRQQEEAARDIITPEGQVLGPGSYFRTPPSVDENGTTTQRAHKLVHREIDPNYDWREVFLDNLEDTGFVLQSAKLAGISHTHVYRERRNDPEFAARWDAALASSIEGVEAEAKRRAMQGSDLLLMFFLKAKKPEVYREQYDVRRTNVNIEVTGDDMNRALQGLAQWQQQLQAGEITGQPVEIIEGHVIRKGTPDGTE